MAKLKRQMSKKLPNFFIVGAPKAGTTSLYHYLKMHPEVYMSPIKEPNYFSYDETVKQNLYHKEKGVATFDRYERLFEHANGRHKAIGEASVSYLFYPPVPGRIKEKVPGARIIMSLRNPVDRAISHYYMEYKLGYVRESLEDIVFKKSKHKYAHLYYQQYVELGLYAAQVKRYIETFGRDQVRIYIHDDLHDKLPELVTDVMHFLGLNPENVPSLNDKYNTYSTPRNMVFRFLYSQKNLRNLARKLIPQQKVDAAKKLFLTRGKKQVVSEQTKAELRRIYADDIKELEKLIGRDLSTWYE